MGRQKHPLGDASLDPLRFMSASIPENVAGIDALWLVDNDGEVFRRADSGALDYPILTGITPELTQEHPKVARAVIDDALNIHKAVDGDDQIALAELSEIHFDANAGFSLILRSGTRVLLGFADPAPALDRLSRECASEAWTSTHRSTSISMLATWPSSLRCTLPPIIPSSPHSPQYL